MTVKTSNRHPPSYLEGRGLRSDRALCSERERPTKYLELSRISQRCYGTSQERSPFDFVVLHDYIRPAQASVPKHVQLCN